MKLVLATLIAIIGAFGFVRSADAQWTFNGVKIYYTAGNVGVGTSDPKHALDVRSAGARAVSGLALAGSGTTSGIFGQSKSVSGRGVVGIASSTTGANRGVYGRTYSPDGYAAYFLGGRNYFQGNLGIGASDPQQKLVVDGNAQITGWIGTTENSSVVFHSNGATVLRLKWASDGVNTSPNLLGGHSSNAASAGVVGAVIGGGGMASESNTVSGDFGAICGGFANVAGEHAFVGAGHYHQATGHGAVIGGGNLNIASGTGSTIAGGYENNSTATQSTVGGGYLNFATANWSTVAGGEDNVASGIYSTIGGGASNAATDNDCTIGGGTGNTAGNGGANTTDATHATVSGGSDNSATAFSSSVAGGKLNVAAGQYSTVAGGNQNVASGQYSFAAGRRGVADHDGAFVWADSTNADVISTAANQFTARASGGVRFMNSAGVGVQLAAGGNSWAALSDRHYKTNITAIDVREVLAKLVSIPITRWNLISQDESIQHIGPMAQDFYAAFVVGEDDTHISQTDADGVALAAIQGLHQLLEEKEAQIKAQQEAIENLRAQTDAQIDDLHKRMARLEAMMLGRH